MTEREPRTLHFSQAQLDGRSCIWCDREGRRMVPTGHLGGRQLFRCYPSCEESLGPDRPQPAPEPDVMGDYLAAGWSIGDDGAWTEP